MQLLLVHPDSMNRTCPSAADEVESDDPGGTHDAEYRPGSKKVASMLCCDRTWVARHGMPHSPAELESRDLVSFPGPDVLAEYMRGAGVQAVAADVRVISDNAVVAWEMVKQGLGVGFMMREIADRTSDVVQLFPNNPPMPVPVWLVSHRELRTSRRIRAVFDILSEAFAQLDAHPRRAGDVGALAESHAERTGGSTTRVRRKRA